MLRHFTIAPVLWVFAAGAIQAADGASGLNIRIIEGQGQKYALGSRATRGVTIEVTDDLGKPVQGATVTFRLPDQGAGGVFSNGSKTEVATSQADGRAQVWGMQWNRTPGPFEIRIAAVKGEAHAGAVCPLSLAEASDVTPSKAVSSGHFGHKWLWIALGAGAAAGAGVAVRGMTNSSSPAVVNTTRIGTPTISIGPPQ
ncbi:MAG TPA: hypothetical protein VKV74_01325 [Bryobacteraceae bacterium]|nr:hypothetical protein [Bryobacteraceae bacterium]